jgi:ribonuclease BN (tRNA processing enzyme)
MTVGHAQRVQPQLECVAYRLDSGEGSVCYSGDSGLCDELASLAQGADILIMMNHHLSGTEPTEAYRSACGNHVDNASLAQRAGVKTMVLTHILQQIDRPGLRERILHEIQQVFNGRVVWGEDLMSLELPEPTQSGIE